MNQLIDIWYKVTSLDNDNQVVSFWQKNQSRIQNLDYKNDLSKYIDILYKITKSLNKKGRFADVFYLFSSTYDNKDLNIKPSESLNNLKYELCYGLHHNRRYSSSKRLIDELDNANFDMTKIASFREQTELGHKRNLELKNLKIESLLFEWGIFVAFAAALLITKEYFWVSMIFYLLLEFRRLTQTKLKFEKELIEFKDDHDVNDYSSIVVKYGIIVYSVTFCIFSLEFFQPDWTIHIAASILIIFQIGFFVLTRFFIDDRIKKLKSEK
ncbi:MAG: hypothetical protein JXQ87_19695 [Bacteroidia bacterium]